MSSGQNSVTVTFSSPLQSAGYRVSVLVNNGAGFSPNDTCMFFTVSSKTTSGFTIENRRCRNGNLVAVDVAAGFDWQVLPDQ